MNFYIGDRRPLPLVPCLSVCLALSFFALALCLLPYKLSASQRREKKTVSVWLFRLKTKAFEKYIERGVYCHVMHFIIQNTSKHKHKNTGTRAHVKYPFSSEYIWARCGILRISNGLQQDTTHTHSTGTVAHIILCLTIMFFLPKQTSGEWTQFRIDGKNTKKQNNLNKKKIQLKYCSKTKQTSK